MTDFEGALFGCCNSPGETCKACCCLPCMISGTSAKLDGNENCCICCYPGSPMKNRAQAKARFGFGPYTISDCCIAAFCCVCSEIQIAREIDKRKITGYASNGPTQQAMP